MDAERFEAQVRRIAISGSRRVILGIGLTLPLALLSVPSSKAKKRKKKCKKKCGPCEKCKQGKCKRVPPGSEACGGKCVPACLSTPELATERDPLTCDCCISNGQSLEVCLILTPCCSEMCSSGTCVGIEQGNVCAFDAQCESGICVLGECA
jgi:hypothetical protein